MKNYFGFSVVSAVIFGSLLSSGAQACDTVFVKSMNGAASSVTVGLSMNSKPADTLGFSLGAGASRTDGLPVGASSPNPLNLGAHVSMGTLNATCSTAISNDPLVGQCSGSVNPNYQLTVSLIPGTPGTTEVHDTAHGNGNAWGTYKHCFPSDAAWKAWVASAPKHLGSSSGWCPGDTTGTPDMLSCQLTLIPATITK